MHDSLHDEEHKRNLRRVPNGKRTEMMKKF